jgi:hypothetical protein
MSRAVAVRRYASALKDWLGNATSILSLFAVILSLVAFYNSEQRRKKDVPFELIPKAYEKYYEMNKIQLEKWYLGHMFTTFDRYPEMKDLIAKGVGNLTNGKRAEYLSHERAVADFLFTYYEQTLLQWAATKDQERKILDDILSYFQGRLLRNPRLVYWWRESGGGLETSYEKETREAWNTKVYAAIKDGKDWCDPRGPFGAGVKVQSPQASAAC